MPEEITPPEELPDEPLPDEPLPDEPLPEEPLPDEPLPDEPPPDEPPPDEPLPDEPFPDEPLPDEPLPDGELPPPDEPPEFPPGDEPPGGELPPGDEPPPDGEPSESGGDGCETSEQANAWLLEHCEMFTNKVDFVEPPVSPGASAIQDIKLQPNFEVQWGCSPQDCLESTDSEELCIIATNPYGDVILKNLTILNIEIVVDGGPPPLLPDGTPSATLTPSRMISFGDLEPEAFVAREAVLLTCGAKPGNYTFKVCYEMSVEIVSDGDQSFELEVVKS